MQRADGKFTSLHKSRTRLRSEPPAAKHIDTALGSCRFHRRSALALGHPPTSTSPAPPPLPRQPLHTYTILELCGYSAASLPDPACDYHILITEASAAPSELASGPSPYQSLAHSLPSGPRVSTTSRANSQAHEQFCDNMADSSPAAKRAR
jgi:hypothetical protein